MAALHSAAHAHINIMPNIYTLNCTLLGSKFRIIKGSDNRSWTVHVQSCVVATAPPPDDTLLPTCVYAAS